MQALDKEAIYRLVEALLRAMGEGQLAALAEFAVTPAIYAEILEELESAQEKAENLRLAPYELAFQPDRSGRLPMDVYSMDADPRSMRVSCQLWSRGRKSDLTLLADYREKHPHAALTFRMLETQ